MAFEAGTPMAFPKGPYAQAGDAGWARGFSARQREIPAANLAVFQKIPCPHGGKGRPDGVQRLRIQALTANSRPGQGRYVPAPYGMGKFKQLEEPIGVYAFQAF